MLFMVIAGAVVRFGRWIWFDLIAFKSRTNLNVSQVLGDLSTEFKWRHSNLLSENCFIVISQLAELYFIKFTDLNVTKQGHKIGIKNNDQMTSDLCKTFTRAYSNVRVADS